MELKHLLISVVLMVLVVICLTNVLGSLMQQPEYDLNFSRTNVTYLNETVLNLSDTMFGKADIMANQSQNITATTRQGEEYTDYANPLNALKIIFDIPALLAGVLGSFITIVSGITLVEFPLLQWFIFIILLIFIGWAFLEAILRWKVGS